MKTLFQLLFVVFLFVVSHNVMAALPTADQAGTYSGTGTITYLTDLDNKKLPKENIGVLLIVENDGQCTLQLVLDGPPLSGTGEAGFGTAAATIAVPVESVMATGRLSIKGKGPKLSMRGDLRLLAGGYLSFAEITLKVKKLEP